MKRVLIKAVAAVLGPLAATVGIAAAKSGAAEFGVMFYLMFFGAALAVWVSFERVCGKMAARGNQIRKFLIAAAYYALWCGVLFFVLMM